MESSTFFMSAIIAFLAYLIGSVPFALVIGKGFYKTDVRKHGSGNLGATNTFRALGKKAGIIVMVGDMAKGSLANLSTSYFGQQLTYAYPWLHCNSRT